MTILYAEDEISIRKPASDSFRLLFDNVLVACDGKEAYEIYKSNIVDVIITDLRMPHSGVDLIGKIREHNQNVPIIITTGYNEFKDIYENTKNIYVMIKPFNVLDIVALIRRAFRDTVKDNKLNKAYKSLKLAQDSAREVLNHLNDNNVSSCDLC